MWDLNVKGKPLEENVSSLFYNLGLGWGGTFKILIQNSEAIKEKIDNFFYIKNKNISATWKQNKTKNYHK